MNNIVTFRLRKFQVLFNLPDQNIIRVNKHKSDSVNIQINGNHGTALVEASTKLSAEKKVLKVFPDSKIIQTTLSTK